MLYLLLFHGNNKYANAPQYIIIRTLKLLFYFRFNCFVYQQVLCAV